MLGHIITRECAKLKTHKAKWVKILCKQAVTWIYLTSFRVIGIFRNRPFTRSDGNKLDGTKLTEPNAAKNMGPEPKLCGTGTKINTVIDYI
jgi:hypothetical protein